MELSLLYQKFKQSSSITTDTRKVNIGSIFFALRGDNFNGNEFAKKALDAGAILAVVDQKEYAINTEHYLLVEDVLTTLQNLANYHRKQLSIPVISLTGSNGKTTTKELINCVLQKKFKTKATIGNLNNHIGVPLTLLSFDENTEIGIVEMGANHQKEIELLCNIAEPDFGYITNFGKAHLEGFGGVEGVIKGKSEMYQYLRGAHKKVFVNSNDALQLEKSFGIHSISFGNQSNDYLKIDRVEANPMVKIYFEDVIVHSNLIGLYNANNINVAIAIGKYFGISNIDIKEAIESYIPTNNRSQILFKSNQEIIMDAYNANPSSMNAALVNFFQLEKKPKIAILGDMFELGNESFDEHHKLVEFCKAQNDIQFYFVGKEFSKNKIEKSNMKFYETFESFALGFSTPIDPNLILIKGSRGMSLERILDKI